MAGESTLREALAWHRQFASFINRGQAMDNSRNYLSE